MDDPGHPRVGGEHMGGHLEPSDTNGSSPRGLLEEARRGVEDGPG